MTLGYLPQAPRPRFARGPAPHWAWITSRAGLDHVALRNDNDTDPPSRWLLENETRPRSVTYRRRTEACERSEGSRASINDLRISRLSPDRSLRSPDASLAPRTARRVSVGMIDGATSGGQILCEAIELDVLFVLGQETSNPAAIKISSRAPTTTAPERFGVRASSTMLSSVRSASAARLCHWPSVTGAGWVRSSLNVVGWTVASGFCDGANWPPSD